MTPRPDSFQTQYEKPVLVNKLVGRFTVRWENDDGSSGVCRSWTRFHDFDGRSPSWRSVRDIVQSFRTRAQVRRVPILPDPVPFLVYDAIDFLSERVVKGGSRVLEVGGGNSTLWFLGQGAEVVTIEGDADWASDVQRRAGDGTRLTLEVLKGSDALDFIDTLPDGSFDVAVIDSNPLATRRGPALGHALPKLRKGGWMVLDNSDHPRYRDAAALMPSSQRRTFSGYGPMNVNVTQTSVWQVS